MRKSADPLSTTLKKLASVSHGLACFGQVLQHSERSSLDVVKNFGPNGWRGDRRAPLVVRLMRGCYHQNPAKPRYNEMWDSVKVSAFIGLLGEN